MDGATDTLLLNDFIFSITRQTCFALHFLRATCFPKYIGVPDICYMHLKSNDVY